MRIKIAARRSDLARLQAYLVGEALQKAEPSLEISYEFKESLGDKNLNDPLWKMPQKGVFTEDFTADLVNQRVDLVVHSWKDLPYEESPQTEIAATLPRADVRDLLLFKKSSRPRLASATQLRIFSSSPRRSYNLTPFLQHFLPAPEKKVEFLPVRGNILTRLRKMIESPEVDALVLAKAALDRLLLARPTEFQDGQKQIREILSQCDWMVLPLSRNPAAPSQGALAVEILRSRPELRELLQKINHRETFADVLEERKLAASYGGGCHQKIGATVITRPMGQILFLRGETDAGQILNERRRLQVGMAPESLWTESSSGFFKKEKRKVEVPAACNALYVSHAAAWVPGSEASRVVWTAGLSTWKSLALQGVWVNGSSEGLGEDDDLRLDALAPNLRWAKLAHTEAVESSEKLLIPSYELIAKTDIPLIDESFAAYYWRSASLFRWAVARQPALLKKKHYCGPGHTLSEIKKHVPVEILWPLEGDLT